MRWANENPERMAEIAALPLHMQNAALRDAIGYDPDAIRDRICENDLSGEPAGRTLPSDGSVSNDSRDTRVSAPHSKHHTGASAPCGCCGAPEGVLHAHWCDLRGRA